jgi:hypothetical protein
MSGCSSSTRTSTGSDCMRIFDDLDFVVVIVDGYCRCLFSCLSRRADSSVGFCGHRRLLRGRRN